MKAALLFDIDSTLTPPRLPITKDMVEILNRLIVPFHVAAGSHLELLEKQFFEPLYDHGYRGNFEAFVSNGALHFHCDFTGEPSMEEIDMFDIRAHLGEQAYVFLIDTLKQTMEIPAFQLPPHLKVFGDIITYRISMVNFSPIGRVKVETHDVRENRNNFVHFDKKTNYRRNILRHYDNVLSDLMAKQNLRITLGGQTSFDVGVLNQDKSKAVKTLHNLGIERVIFIGAALFEGGNDAIIREYIDAMPVNPSRKAEYHQVDSYQETISLLNQLGLLT